MGLCTLTVPAAATAQRLSARTLREGMRGSAVRSLQRQLAQAGMSSRETGIFDVATVRAVRSFERRYHLPVTGLATPAFMRVLRTIGGYDRAAVDRPAPARGMTADVTNAAGGGGGLTGTTGIGTSPTGGTATGTTAVGTTTTGGGTATGTTTVGTTDTGAPITVTTYPARRYASRMMRVGMSGSDVEDLQDYLTLAGYPTSVDGVFGPKTRHSVVIFQRASSLAASGVISRSEAVLLKDDVAKAVPTAAMAGQATLSTTGMASAPSDAPIAVQQAIAAANSITSDPYIYGGGHASFTDTGYDCSGSVSFALHGGGLLSAPEDSTQLETYGDPGPGKWITVYADAAHAFVVIAGLAFDTAHYGPTFPAGTGPRWLSPLDVTANLSDGGDYVVRHPAGL